MVMSWPPCQLTILATDVEDAIPGTSVDRATDGNAADAGSIIWSVKKRISQRFAIRKDTAIKHSKHARA